MSNEATAIKAMEAAREIAKKRWDPEHHTTPLTSLTDIIEAMLDLGMLVVPDTDDGLTDRQRDQVNALKAEFPAKTGTTDESRDLFSEGVARDRKEMAARNATTVATLALIRDTMRAHGGDVLQKVRDMQVMHSRLYACARSMAGLGSASADSATIQEVEEIAERLELGTPAHVLDKELGKMFATLYNGVVGVLGVPRNTGPADVLAGMATIEGTQRIVKMLERAFQDQKELIRSQSYAASALKDLRQELVAELGIDESALVEGEDIDRAALDAIAGLREHSEEAAPADVQSLNYRDWLRHKVAIALGLEDVASSVTGEEIIEAIDDVVRHRDRLRESGRDTRTAELLASSRAQFDYAQAEKQRADRALANAWVKIEQLEARVIELDEAREEFEEQRDRLADKLKLSEPVR